MIALLAVPLAAKGPPALRPTLILDLHTDVQWPVVARVQFDPKGRVLILYRDKSKLRPGGNWHLARLTDVQSGKPIREEILFSIPQEPGDDRRRFDSYTLPSADGSLAYVIIEGTSATPKPGVAGVNDIPNVSLDHFASVHSFDLVAFRVVASADVSEPRAMLTSHGMDAQGNLLLVRANANADAVGFEMDAQANLRLFELQDMCGT